MHQHNLAKTVRCLAYLLKRAGVDRELEVYYTCPSVTPPFKARESSKLEKFVSAHAFGGVCDLAERLDHITGKILQDLRGERSKPVSIYVLTNARWNNLDDSKDLCGVDAIIRKVVKSIKDANKPDRTVGFQFIRFLDEESPELDNEVGKPRLDALDNDLARQFEEMGLSRGDAGDIVDTRDYNGDICSILTGGISREGDRT